MIAVEYTAGPNWHFDCGGPSAQAFFTVSGLPASFLPLLEHEL